MCVENSVKGLGPKCFGKVVRSPMAAVGFLRSLWEEAIWEGVWLNLDPMDTVLAHSVHGMERAREVRAAWRALFLPDSEGAGDCAEQ